MKDPILPFGTLIGTPNVAGVNVPLFSNEATDFVSRDFSVSANGEILGLKYQCVEFVRQFIYKSQGVNLHTQYNKGDAHDWFKNRACMNLKVVEVKDLAPGDILTFNGGDWGHVGVVKAITPNTAIMVSQNWTNSAADLHFPLTKKTLREKEIITVKDSEFVFTGGLRL